MRPILHITTAPQWQSTRQIYTHPSLVEEGFIHCSDVHQVLGPANAYFKGQDDLVILVIDPQRVQSPIQYEDLTGAGVEYPHIYGPLNVDAVEMVVSFPRNKSGTFSLPETLKRYTLA